MVGTLRTHLKRLGAQHRASQNRNNTGKVNKTLEFFTRMTARLVGAERCSIFIVDPENQTIWLKAGTGVEEHGIEVSLEGSIVGQVIETGQVVNTSHLEDREGAHKTTDSRTGFTTRSVLCVPVKNSSLDETVGAIQALNKKDGERFSVEDAELLGEIADQVQALVSRVYLDQEIYGLTEKVLTTAGRVAGYLSVAVFGLFAVLLLVMFLWVVVPALGLNAVRLNHPCRVHEPGRPGRPGRWRRKPGNRNRIARWAGACKPSPARQTPRWR